MREHGYGFGSFDEYMDAVICEGLEKLMEPDKEAPGQFGYHSISQVPYIEYPGFSQEENFFAMDMAKEVLIRSKRENHYNEVSITYSIKNPKSFVVTYGDRDSVKFMEDPEVAKMMRGSLPLMIVSLHNHPNDSRLSLHDLSVFCLADQIKLMTVVNTRGELSFIERTSDAPLQPLLVSAINIAVPDIQQRRSSSEKGGIISLLSPAENRKVSDRLISSLGQVGVIYHDWLSKSIQYDRNIQQGHDFVNGSDTKIACDDIGISGRLKEDSAKPSITAMCGLPGSGKTKLAERLHDEDDGSVLISMREKSEEARSRFGTVDYERVAAQIMSDIGKCFSEGKSVIYDASNLLLEHRLQILDIADRYGVKERKLILMKADDETALSNCIASGNRITRRRMEQLKRRMLDNYPALSEGWSELQEKTVPKKSLSVDGKTIGRA